MNEMSHNQAEIIEIYCNIDQALENGDLQTALAGLKQVQILCGNDSVMLEGLVSYIHERVNSSLNQGLITGLEQLITLAEQTVEQTGDHELQLSLGSLKGRFYCETERYQEAAAVFADLVHEAEKLEWLELAAEAWHGWGVAEHALANYREAEAFLRKAAEYFGQVQRPQEQAYSLYMLGLVGLDAGTLESALLAHEQAAAILFRLGDNDELARVWHEQSLCYLEQGLYEQALAKNDQVIQFYRRQELDLTRPLVSRVGILFALGAVEEAGQLLEESFVAELEDDDSSIGEFLRLWRGILGAHTGQLKAAAEAVAASARVYRDWSDYNMEAACCCLAGLYFWLDGAGEQAEAQWQSAVAEPGLRKTQPWLNGLLKRCLDRVIADYAGRDSDGDELEAKVCDAACRCGFVY
ncbi:MAG TPA: hypothetical protein VEC37_16080 [Bacillota bacterium]|nr:hypothetical protein [Bacillota bacterium]